MEIQIVGQNNNFTCQDVSNGVGFEFPETRGVIEDIPARDGALYIGSQFGRRALSWQGAIKGEGIFANRRSLIEACRVGMLKTIRFTSLDNIPLQAEIEILSLIMPYRFTAMVYSIESVAPDYRFYSQSLISQSTVVTQSEGGTPIPAAIPAPIGGGSSIDFILTNDGNINTNPVFIIKGPGTNFIVQNTTTGEQFNLNLTLLSNESVIIDTRLRTAFKGSQNVFGSFSGDWMILAPGTNRIVFNASSGSEISTLLTVNYRNAYLGI